MSMMFGKAWGGYCFGFTEEQIRFVSDDSFFRFIFYFFIFFIKSNVVGTHYITFFTKF